MKRFKSYGLWISIASLVLIVLQQFYPLIDAGKYNHIVDAVLYVLVGLGVIDNPTTDNKFYGDDK